MTDWNQRYLEGNTPWDKGAAAPPLLELLEKHGTEWFGNGLVLAPGCGTGHDVRALAASGLRVTGLDLAPEAITLANTHPLSSNESYELGDFLEQTWQPKDTLSAIWEHTCFCAIDPSQRNAYSAACARLLPPGSHLVGVFFLTPNAPGEEDDGPPFNSTIEELDSRFSPWFERIDSWIPERSYPGREGLEWTAIYRRNHHPHEP